MVCFHITSNFSFCAHHLDVAGLITRKTTHTKCGCGTAGKFHIHNLMINNIIIRLIYTLTIICFLQGFNDAFIRSIMCKVFGPMPALRSEEHTSELQSRGHLVCRLLLEQKKKIYSAVRLTEA